MKQNTKPHLHTVWNRLVVELQLSQEHLLEEPTRPLPSFNRRGAPYVNSAALLLDPRYEKQRRAQFSQAALQGLVYHQTEEDGEGPTRFERPLFCCPACQELGQQNIMQFGNLHETYRDPHFLCEVCGLRYRSDLTRLDLDFAWRDGISMPKELRLARPKRSSVKVYKERT